MTEGLQGEFSSNSGGAEMIGIHQLEREGNKPTDKKKTSSFLKPSKKVKPDSMLELDHALWGGDVEAFLKGLPMEPLFDLVVTSPPYNIGKSYETKKELEHYLAWQERIIEEIVPRRRPVSGEIK